MKSFKHICIALSLLLACVSASAAGKHEVTLSDASIRKSGDRVVVNFTIDPKHVPTNYKIVLVPVIYNGQGWEMALEPVTISGRNKRLMDRRKDFWTDHYHLATRKAEPFLYSESLPFEEWMQTVSVAVYQVGESCCCRYAYDGIALLEDKLLYFNPEPAFSREKLDYQFTELEKYDLENPFLHPVEEYPRRYDILVNDREKGTSKVVFKAGSAVIDPAFQGNGNALEAIEKALELIENDPNATLEKIVIAGYASPEGSLALNTRLAQARAEAVKKYLKTRIYAPDNIFELYNGREDWDGLRTMVEQSVMPTRDDVLDIIDSYTMEQEIRKDKLKQFEGGASYRYMLKNFYPELRSGGYLQVFYRIDRRATVAAAVTDPQGRTVWIDPESPENIRVTTINKAVDLMCEGSFDEALQLLEPYGEDPATWNAIGVCYMMKGDYDRADVWLLKAVGNGDRDATANLEQTRLARQVEK